MADWRQIQARIRKAKHSPDAPAKLSELFQRTRDAMVAWELGVVEEKSGNNEEAGKWYSTAFQRFRRADWKKKAEEALTRLGMPLPEHSAETAAEPGAETAPAADRHTDVETESAEPSALVSEPLALGEISDSEHAEHTPLSSGSTTVESNADAAGVPGKKKRRRGRRGGRGRGRRSATAPPGLPSRSFAESPESTERASPEQAPERFNERVPERVSERVADRGVERRSVDRFPDRPVTPARPETRESEERPGRAAASLQLPSERAAHGRGDPGLASRMAHLESMLRRMLSSPLHRLDEAEDAPAGPGVFLLSESDQTTSYYIESCQTLRIGVGNLLRGGRAVRSGRGAPRGGPETSSLKSKLADHLGINEAKVSQYLKDHCAVRWIQMDDEAPLLAHFAIGVLRTPLNLD
jgi:hypothetical protein